MDNDNLRRFKLVTFLNEFRLQKITDINIYRKYIFSEWSNNHTLFSEDVFNYCQEI
jgi:hypothetical protein